MVTSIAARGGGGSFKMEKIYNSEEHVPIESFVTTIHWTFFLMTRTKFAFVGFVAAGNSMWHQVLDDLCLVVTDQSATTCDSSYAPNSTQYNSYYKVLKSATPVLFCTTKYYSRKYYSSTTPVLQSTTPVLQGTSPVLLRTTKYYFVLQSTSPVLLRTTKYYSSTTPYYKVLQSTSPVLPRTTKY